MPQIRGGPLDGLAIENLPGPLLAAVVTYLDPVTGEATSATLLPGCSCHSLDSTRMADVAAAARGALRDAGIDPDLAVADVEARARVQRVDQPKAGGR